MAAILIPSALRAGFNTFIAKDGWMDISNESWEEQELFEMEGDWEIYWDQLLTPSDLKNRKYEQMRYFYMPKDWSAHVENGKTISGHGCVTFRLRVILPHHTRRPLALYSREINSAYKIWCNDSLLHEEGTVCKDKNRYRASRTPVVMMYTPQSDTLQIILQVANYSHRTGGIYECIRIGYPEYILKYRSVKSFYDLFLFGSMFIMALYHFALFFMRRKDKYSLYFAVGTSLLSVRSLISGENLLLYLIPSFSWELSYKIEYICFYLYIPFFALLLHSLYPNIFRKELANFYMGIAILLSLLIITTPANIYSHTLTYYEVFALLSGLFFLGGLIKAAMQKDRDAYIFLIGGIVLFISMVNDILYWRGIVHTLLMLPVGLYIYILLQSVILAIRFTKTLTKNEKLGGELGYLNANLANIVNQRTEEVKQQREELAIQAEYLRSANIEIMSINDEMTRQKSVIEEKNIKITSGIETARVIQSAFLPSDETIREMFPQHFIMYKPRDIVSGDFYWCRNIEINSEEVFAFAVGDCTGHGVPGAFLSTFGISFLNEIFTQNTNAVIHASFVLEEMRRKMKEILHQSQEGFLKEGIDIAICLYNKKHHVIEYSGAYSPAYLITAKSDKPVLSELKPVKNPIGIYPREQAFEDHLATVGKGDMLYLFSDGYHTQLGGPEGRKLMTKRFKEILLNNYHRPADIQKQKLEAALAEWQKTDHDQTDDITIVGIKF